MRQSAEGYSERLTRTALAPLGKISRNFVIFIAFFLAVAIWGLYAYIQQLRNGLVATGMRDQVMWGFYLVNFVFFIGISHAGTLISAILRVSHAGWRTPVTRMAELITVVAISVGALMPVIDLGRPDRVQNIILFGRFQSPLLWDIISITCYLTGSLTYLYLPLIPDLALMRDRLKAGESSLKRSIYTALAVGWKDSPEQRFRLEKAIGIMAVTIIPIAVSVHTVVSFVFSMLLRPGFESTVFGIYFVVGAIFSGIATILIVMAIFRKLYHLEEYITEKHFKYLSYLLLATLLIYAYLTFGEYLTMGYTLKIDHKLLLETLFVGQNAVWFWFFVIGGTIIPAALLIYRRGPLLPKILTASVLINIGMWIKRFVIILPSLQVPLMPYDFGSYTPTWVEWSITAGAISVFILIFALVTRFMPVLSIWEVAEHHEAEMASTPEPAHISIPASREVGVRG